MLGTGSIAVHHLRAWQAIDGVQIVALANRTRERAVRLGDEFGIDERHIYADYRDLLRNESLDFVDIATAPDIHREQVLAAAAHGVHVLCQKPFATSLREATEMIAACATADVRCVVNENWRWRRWYRDVKALINQGVIGAPRYARFQYHDGSLLAGPGDEPPALLTRQPYTAEMPRLILYEWGIHLVDVLRFLLGDIERVYARMRRASELVRGEAMALVVLEFRSGATGVIDISWGSHGPKEQQLGRGHVEPLVVEGDAGMIALDPYPEDWMIVTTAGGTERRPTHVDLSADEAYQESYLHTQRHFIEALRTKLPAENEAGDNLKTLAAVLAAYASAEQGQVVAAQAAAD